MKKRIRRQSDIEATKRYTERTYKKVNFALRKVDDADILNSLEKAQKHGLKSREWLRDLYERATATK